MGKKLDKRFILSDNSVNRYGFRVMTEGLNIPSFKKNPVMLWMHYRDEGTHRWCDYKPIGHWEDIEVDEKGQLSACPYFDLTDDLSKEICAKVEEGTISATSIGLVPITFSDDAKHVLPGQKRATVIKADLMEASFCDIPANRNAVRLYEDNALGLDFHSLSVDIPLLKTDKPMKLKETMKALLAFLKIAPEKASETDLTDEQLSAIDNEMQQLRDKSKECETLSTQLATLKSETGSIISTLKAENAALREQVQNLSHQPADVPSPVVTKEPLAAPADPLEELLAFCSSSDDYSLVIAKGRELGVFQKD